MHPGALLDLATELLRAVLKFDQPADVVVSAFFRAHRLLGSRERHALAEMVFAVLRQRLLLQHLAGLGTAGDGGAKVAGGDAGAAGPGGKEGRKGEDDKDATDRKDGAGAKSTQGAKAAKAAKGTKGHKAGAHALERRMAVLAWPGTPAPLRGALGPHEVQWLDAVSRIDRGTLPDKLRHNLPDWLAGALRDKLGDQFWPLVHALEQPAPLDLRVNLLKGKREQAQAALAEAGIVAAPTPHSPWGLRVEGKPALNKVPVFVDGGVEVQDEGSQLLALLVDAHRGEMVVDFCAGAGGKTLALGAAMRNTGRLYAFDISGHRLDALKPRLARSGLSNVHPVQIAHERDDRIKRLAGKIHRVLIDAPCSGLGTLRRNPGLKWQQSPKAVQDFQQTQRRILDAAARLLKPGGRLVYATCSLLDAENEEVVRGFDAAMADHFEPLPVRDLLLAAHVEHADELVAGPWLRLWPHRHQTDGFFAAVWQRR